MWRCYLAMLLCHPKTAARRRLLCRPRLRRLREPASEFKQSQGAGSLWRFNQLGHPCIACLLSRVVSQVCRCQIAAVMVGRQPDDGEPEAIAARMGQHLAAGPVALVHEPAEGIIVSRKGSVQLAQGLR